MPKKRGVLPTSSLLLHPPLVWCPLRPLLVLLFGNLGRNGEKGENTHTLKIPISFQLNEKFGDIWNLPPPPPNVLYSRIRMKVVWEMYKLPYLEQFLAPCYCFALNSHSLLCAIKHHVVQPSIRVSCMGLITDVHVVDAVLHLHGEMQPFPSLNQMKKSWSCGNCRAHTYLGQLIAVYKCRLSWWTWNKYNSRFQFRLTECFKKPNFQQHTLLPSSEPVLSWRWQRCMVPKAWLLINFF